MLITTTTITEDKEILGPLFAEAVFGVNFVKDILANLKSFFGGSSGSHIAKLMQNRELLLTQIEEQAREKGADAIEGLHISYSTISTKNDVLIVVLIYGTAIKIKPQNFSKSEPVKHRNIEGPHKDIERPGHGPWA